MDCRRIKERGSRKEREEKRKRERARKREGPSMTYGLPIEKEERRAGKRDSKYSRRKWKTEWRI